MTFLSPVKRGFGDRKAPDKTYPNMTLCKRLLILYRIALRGGLSLNGGSAGPFYLNLNNDAGDAWWNIGGDLSLAAAQLAVLLVVTYFARSICLSSSYNLAHPETLVGGKRRTKWFVAKESL